MVETQFINCISFFCFFVCFHAYKEVFTLSSATPDIEDLKDSSVQGCYAV